MSLGVAIIQQFVKTLTDEPGVYQMLDAEAKVLYVGKAKNLKKRVISYTKPEQQSVRIQRMIAHTASMVFQTTQTEVEALLLEANLIKQLKPRYNILLRDDKSYPCLLIRDHEFPQILKHRGAQTIKGKYFGPFASALAVNQTQQALERIFTLRNCTDNVFNHRSRPCLQYHIKRCSAPCVGKIDKTEYHSLVGMAEDFLKGRSSAVQQKLADEMQRHADALEYEKAAALRDRIAALSEIQRSQLINVSGIDSVDIVGFYRSKQDVAIQLIYYRYGRNFGNRPFFIKCAEDEDNTEIMQAFLVQYYRHMEPPALIFMEYLPSEQQLIEQSLGEVWQKKLNLRAPMRGDGVQLVKQANQNARAALEQKVTKEELHQNQLNALAELIGMEQTITRVEIYDNSHIQGSKPVGAMVVANQQGFDKKSYRLFNFAEDKSQAGGDDFAMMELMLTRRFTRALFEGQGPETTHGFLPELLIIDGGMGQLNIALRVLAQCGLIEKVRVIAVAKGEERNSGREVIHIPPWQGAPARQIALPTNHATQFFIQRLRDEAHRFAIGAHRKKRSRAIKENPLSEIDGVGAVKRRALLNHFGSVSAVMSAQINDLKRVKGIDDKIAEKIYNFFKENK